MTDLWAEDLALALELADAADVITLDRFRALDLRVDRKPDATPVSDADLAVEARLRAVLAAARPIDGILGEESGTTNPSATRRWIIDPIDGTKGFVRGVPVWASLIALEVNGEVVVGVASAPALGQRWWASAGNGAFADGRPITVSSVAALGDASLSYSSLSGWRESGLFDAFIRLTENVWRTRAFGDFWSHLLVAEGAVDIAAEPEVSLWDLAALDIIVREAGGRFTALSGEPGPAGGSAVSSNGLLHDEVLKQLTARTCPPR